MKSLSRILFCCFLVSGSSLSALAEDDTLLIESNGKKVTYVLDGVNTPIGIELMRAVGKIITKEPDGALVIIFDSTIPLKVVSDAQKIASKPGFRKITFFAQSRAFGMMREVSFGKPVLIPDKMQQ